MNTYLLDKTSGYAPYSANRPITRSPSMPWRRCLRVAMKLSLLRLPMC